MKKAMVDQIAWAVAKARGNENICEPLDYDITKAALETLLNPTQLMIDSGCQSFMEDDETRSPDELAEDIFKDMVQVVIDQIQDRDLS